MAVAAADTACSPIGAGKEDGSGIVKERRRDRLTEEKMGDGEGGWDWLVVLGGLPFQESSSVFQFAPIHMWTLGGVGDTEMQRFHCTDFDTEVFLSILVSV